MELRKDVEGLRAVAILLVVAAHAGVPGLAGGFIGVDVFFVLSGFLITGLLVGEHERTGRLDFKSFYSRRFRRLLPALAVMLLVTGALATQLIPITQQAAHAASGIAAAFWLSNLHFALSATEYFAAHDNLFLHTWSLGVEEQFYLLWPLLLATTLSMKGANSGRVRTTMWAVALASFVACIWLSWTSTLLAFYLMPMRAWQFALGALVWLYFAKRQAPAIPGFPVSSRMSSAGAWAGLALIFFPAAFLDGGFRYPGLWSLLPTLGTCLVLVAGSVTPRNPMPIRLLMLPPIQWLGRLSYGWYLWHWPALVLGASVFDMGNGWIRAALVTGALVMAWVSYHLVEHPIRRSRRWPLAPLKTILVSLAIMAGLAAVGLRWMESSMRLAGEWSSTHRISLPAIYGMDCDRWYQDAELTPCVFEPEADPPRATVVLMGDSIGLQWFPAFEALAQRHRWRLVVLTKSACAMVDEPIYYARIGREYSECSQWRRDALAHVAALTPDAVLIGSSSGYAFDSQQWVDGTRRVLDSLAASAVDVGILRATPVLPFSGDSCMSFHTPLREWLGQTSRCSASALDAERDAVAGYLGEAAAPFDNVTIVDMNQVVCPGDRCHAEREGMLVYRDTQHLNAAYVETLADPLETRLREAMPRLFVDQGSESVPSPAK